jgi:amino acid adenylation domain-containing protein
MSTTYSHNEISDFAQKRHLLSKLIKRGVETKRHVVARRTDPSTAPLSLTQHKLWLIHKIDPSTTRYNESLVFEIDNDLSVDGFAKAFSILVERHETLRTTFSEIGGGPLQIIGAPFKSDIRLIDLQGVAADEQRQTIKRVVEEQEGTPFDLSQPPLFRAAVLQCGERQNVVVLTFHHIIVDTWSVPILLSELVECYLAGVEARPPRLAPLPIQYGDFAQWQQGWFAAGEEKRQLEYWRGQFSGDLPVQEIETDFPRPSEPTYRGERIGFALDEGLMKKANAISAQHNVTNFMLLLASIYAWLHRWSGQSDIVVGSPVANRRIRETEALIGFFANTLPLRIEIEKDSSFIDLLHQVRELVLRAFDNQDIPFERIVETLDVTRDPSRNPLFQTLFNYESAWTSPEFIKGRDLIKPIDLGKATSKFDLSFYIGLLRGRMEGVLEYSQDLFSEQTAHRMVKSFLTLMGSTLSAPHAPLGALPLMAGEERRMIISDWSRAGGKLDFAKTLVSQLERQAAATPEAAAVRFEGIQIAYRELNERANRIARRLLNLGVAREAVVGVLAERGENFLPMLIGVLKAGAAYLPLDPDLPIERLKLMASEAAVELILTDASLADRLAAFSQKVLTASEAIADRELADSNPNLELHPDNLAYVLYTSGSTGTPKASMISHRAICNRLAWMQAYYRLEAGERVLQKTAFSFDVSLWELFWPLTAGGCVVLAQPNGQRDMEYIRRTIQAERISTLHFVPSMLGAFLGEVSSQEAPALRRIICSGEALLRSSVEKARQKLPAVAVYNLYGPTETTVDVTAWDCSDDHGLCDPPIGRPIANVQAYILDDRMEPVPPGVRGDLYIGGIALARGYHRRPGLTADRFPPNPFAAGERLYHTGDKAKFGETGQIYFLGRGDAQIKLRGYRIELGEIEATILRHSRVRQTAVILRQGPNDFGQLVAYLVPGKASENEAAPADEPALIEEIETLLSEQLPGYMRPSAFVVVDNLPMQSSGKLDVKALPVPRRAAVQERVAPRTPTENALAEIWREVMRDDSIGMLDNFFEVGGDSIRSVRVTALARERGLAFSVQQIFKHQTIAELARVIDETPVAPAPAHPDAVGAAAGVYTGVDVSLVNLQAEAIDRILAGRPDAIAIMPVAPSPWDLIAQWKATGRKEINLVQTLGYAPNVDIDVVRKVVNLMIEANPVLRTSYYWDGLDEPVQIVHRSGQLEVSQADWRGLSPQEQRARAKAALTADGLRGAEPHKPTPWRMFFGRVGERDYILLQTFNYISLDGWSMLTIGREMMALYAAHASGGTAAPAARPSYQTYLAWVKNRDMSSAEAFWKEELKDYTPLGLTDVFIKQRRDRSAGYASKGALLPSQLTQRVRDALRARQITEGVFYLGAWALLMAHLTKRLDNVLGVVIAGRSPEVPDIQNMIGYTMNYQPFRLAIDQNDSVQSLFVKIKCKSITLMDYDTVSLQQIRKWCGYSDDSNLFDTLFYFQNIGGYFLDGHSQVINQRRPLAYSRTAYALRFDIFPTVAEIGNQLFAGYERADLTTEEAMRIMTLFAEAVARMDADPSQPVGEILDHLARLEGCRDDQLIALEFEDSNEQLW